MSRCLKCRARRRGRSDRYCRNCGAKTEIQQLSDTADLIVRIGAGAVLCVALAALL